MINVVPKSIMHNDSEITRADHKDAPFVTTFGPYYTQYISNISKVLTIFCLPPFWR